MFFWNYSIYSYSGIGITEHTEYQFPKEQTLCWKQNSWRDKNWRDGSGPRKSGYTILLPKTGEDCQKDTILSAIGSRIDGILSHSFRNQNRSKKNTITANSVYSHSGIVPKEQTLSMTWTCVTMNVHQLQVEWGRVHNVHDWGIYYLWSPSQSASRRQSVGLLHSTKSLKHKQRWLEAQSGRIKGANSYMPRKCSHFKGAASPIIL